MEMLFLGAGVVLLIAGGEVYFSSQRRASLAAMMMLVGGLFVFGTLIVIALRDLEVI